MSRSAWHGEPGQFALCASEAEAAGAEVILGDWTCESEHRRFALDLARKRGFKYAIIPDGDEVLEPSLVDALAAIARTGLADRVYAHMDTYWKSARYVVRPRERLTPAILLNLEVAEHRHIRDFEGGRPLVLGPEYGVIHHLSYAGPDERIQRKLETWSHRNEVQSDWYRKIWLGWDEDPLMSNLHPTHPPAYGFVERIDVPDTLAGVWDERPVAGDPPVPKNWPKVSIVIPLHGGKEDIVACLQSLEKCQDLLHETIVVDDASPDDAPKAVAKFKFAKLIRNKTNLGFAATCNCGYEASAGEVVVFLNSDTIVPRAGLVRLVESLMESGTIGATGPYTNNAGYDQPIDVTYTDPGNVDNFARDFAYRNVDDKEVPLLVGFCLAVRRSVLQEVGAFDERFGRGLFEDNDLCYRIQRAGYKIRIAAKSFVHHEGSKSLSRIGEPPQVLLARNMDLYHAKWRADTESCFASHLPGQAPGPIAFQKDRHPDAVVARAKKLKPKANISLCMIVRDEERVIRDCLESAAPFFNQIVVVDTGSTDRTVEICRECGAEVHEMQWPDSFSIARNESLKHAKGDWIFWMDADDTLPPACGEAILNAAIHAPAEIAGYIVPVQFVEEGPGAGTRVDHVKLFRNRPGIEFEGRIHEQVLASLRRHGEIARLQGAIVLHSGYDNSEEGQAKKRLRDERLLRMDLKERPNHPFALFNIGMTAHYCGDHKQAVDWLKKSIKHSGKGDSHVRKAYALMGTSLRLMGLLKESLAALGKGIAAVGNDPELRFQRGIVLCELGRFEEAKKELLEMDLDTSGFFSSIDVGILGFKRSANIGRACLAMGDYPGAREWLLRAFEQNPRFQDPAVELAEAALERHDGRTAQEVADLIKQRCGPTVAWAEIQTRAMELRGESPDRFLQLQTRLHPTAIGPRLQLVRRMLASGYEAEAAPHLEILDGLGNAEAAYFRGISATRRGDFVQALIHMERAHQLNPGHEPTRQQIASLKSLLGGGN